MAATNDQAAFILSIPKRKMMDETQETLRTSAFPSTHVKVWTHICHFLTKQIVQSHEDLFHGLREEIKMI